MSGVFDLKTPAEFFGTILRIYDRYQRSNEKDIEDLLYVLMGLNHLREWIAPGYSAYTRTCEGKQKNLPRNRGEVFYNEIWDDTSSFKIINSLCNRTKHLKTGTIRGTTSSSHDIPFDDWSDVDAVRDFDLGPASKYLVDGRDVVEIINDVIAFYRTKWFERK